MYVILYAMYVILYVMYVCSGRLACFYLILFLVKRIEHFNHLDMRYINALYYYYHHIDSNFIIQNQLMFKNKLEFLFFLFFYLFLDEETICLRQHSVMELTEKEDIFFNLQSVIGRFVDIGRLHYEL